MPKVALITAKVVKPPHHDPDMSPMLAALGEHDVHASAVCWDDDEVEWGSFDLAILRSTWDYVDRYDEFFDWLTQTEQLVPVQNPSSTVRWSTNKRYLEDLESHGLPTVETRFIDPGDPVVVPDWPELVVKPAIGAGAKDAARHSSTDDAVQHVRRLVDANRTAMVQPYLESVDHYGETGLVYFNGAFSHAFKKDALLQSRPQPSDGLFAIETIETREPADDELALAEAVVETFGSDLLYARIDVVRDRTGSAVVLEVELAEPSFFLEASGAGAEGFARAVLERL